MSGKHEDHSYDDIIHLPHPVSRTRPPISRHDRAAQFAPFAALTGYEAVVAETARRTETRPELDENELARLDAALRGLAARLPRRPEAVITWFRPDERKAGGAILTVRCRVKKLSLPRRRLVLEDGREISLDDILALAEPEDGQPDSGLDLQLPEL